MQMPVCSRLVRDIGQVPGQPMLHNENPSGGVGESPVLRVLIIQMGFYLFVLVLEFTRGC